MAKKSQGKVKKEVYDVVLQGQPAVKPMVVSQREGEPFRVWSPDEFSRLKRVLIGRPEGTNMPAPEWAWRYDVPGCKLPSHMPFPQDMVDAANEQMNYFVETLEKRGILVDRIPILPMMMNRPFMSPIGWGQLNMHGVNNVRDVTLVHGHIIVDAPTVRRTRVFERFNLRPYFNLLAKEDSGCFHTSCPFPMLTDEDYDTNYYHDRTKRTDEEQREMLLAGQFQQKNGEFPWESLWDGADIWSLGKDMFYQRSAVGNKAGEDWLRRFCREHGFRFHAVTFDTPINSDRPTNFHPWHIDVNMCTPRPGLVILNPDWPPVDEGFTQLFKQNDWEVVMGARPTRVHKNKIFLTGLYEGKSWISLNTFSIDENVMCVEAGETAFMDQLDKLGVEVVPIPYEKVIPFGGALHCTTLDIERDTGEKGERGEYEDYFPNQVEGY
jgi:glycine amidinotransferase